MFRLIQSKFGVVGMGVLAFGGLGLLAGCPSNGSGTTSTPVTSRAVSGTVYGGQQPVVGASITLYAARRGLPAVVLATATTTTNGAFTIDESYTSSCPSPGSRVYIVATGGNPGLLPPSTDNTAIDLMAAIKKPCYSPPSFVHISEVTTVAATYALNRFFAGGNNFEGGFPSAIGAGVNTATERLADTQTGKANSWLPSSSNCEGSSPSVNCGALERMNALANTLATCVNTASASSSACTALFACAKPGASSGGGTCAGGTGTITNTLEAAISVARHPGQVSAAGLFGLAPPSPIFAPTLAAAPPDWTLALNFTASGLGDTRGISIGPASFIWVADFQNSKLWRFLPNGDVSFSVQGHDLGQPFGVTLDGSGNAWVTNHISSPANLANTVNVFNGPTHTHYINNVGGLWLPLGIAMAPNGHVFVANSGEQNPPNNTGNSVSEFDSNGNAISPAPSAYTAGGIADPDGIAVAADGTVWVANRGSDSITHLDPNVTPPTGVNITGGGLSTPAVIAIGPNGDVWAANGSSISEFDSTGTPLSPASGFTGGGLNGGLGIALDADGNVWVATGNDRVAKFDNTGNPLSPSTGFQGPWFHEARSIAVDDAGNVWVGNGSPGSITELVGAAAPTRTPIIAAITQGFAPF